ncbi:MAG TPA: glucoamylase family protein [Candidatus Omnitrophota bacterium]|nr:glucoamylase family protein [Candidatus Omnitrophota bacterium]
MKTISSKNKANVFLLMALALLVSGCNQGTQVFAQGGPVEGTTSPDRSSGGPTLGEVEMVADFETGTLTNNRGGASGDWNWNPADVNNSYTDATIVSMPGADGIESRVLQLTYSVDSDVPARNGFWTKLMAVDGRKYDHLALDIKGDPKRGFTEKFRIEVKKCLDEECQQTIQGSAVISVSEEWETVNVPLNKLTGLIDFSDPDAWTDPKKSYDHLDELIIIFNDVFVTKKSGRIFIDNIRFLNTGKPGPSAVDQPPRTESKTELKHDTLEYQRFLITRLRGFPEKVRVSREFPQEEREFLIEVARDTWKFFDEVIDVQNHLPLDNITLGEEQPDGEGLWIGDYTNVTNVGIYLMSVVSAYDLGFISRENAVRRIRETLGAVEKLEYHASGFPYNYYDTTVLDKTSYFVSFVDSGWLLLGLYVAKAAFPEELDEQATRLLGRGDLRFFYDPVEKQMYHGYYANLDVYSDYHYGVFYAEPRAASYMAIARGDVPEEHWFSGPIRTFPVHYSWQSQTPKNRVEKTVLGHTVNGGYYEWKDLQYVPSWGGSAFEALMPTVVLNEKELAPEGLGANNAVHALGQYRYATEELNQPVWGMSPCSVPGGTYAEYGAKAFGIKGYKPGVVTPHASVLTLEYVPKEAVANLRKMIELYDIYGEYGFYDSVDIESGKVARKYYALDQGMILVAINNYLGDGPIRRRFHSNPEMKNAEKLLSEEKFFKETETVSSPES